MSVSPLTDEEIRATYTAAAVLRTVRPDVAGVLDRLAKRATVVPLESIDSEVVADLVTDRDLILEAKVKVEKRAAALESELAEVRAELTAWQSGALAGDQ